MIRCKDTDRRFTSDGVGALAPQVSGTEVPVPRARVVSVVT